MLDSFNWFFVHNRRILLAAMGVVILAHAVQVMTPLRLNTDAIILLSLGTSLADGDGLLHEGRPTHFPPGYPLVVAALVRFELASSAALVWINVLALCVGMIASFGMMVRGLGTSSGLAAAACLLSASSFVFIKHVPIPISDVVFFGVSAAALWLFVEADRQESRSRRWAWLGAGSLAAMAAIAVRTAGVYLGPVAAWTAMGGKPAAIALAARLRASRKARFLAFGSALFLLLAAAASVSQTIYAREAWAQLHYIGPATMLWRLVFGRLGELGQLALNMPESLLPGPLRPLLSVFGVGVAVLVARGFWLTRDRFGAFHVGLATYLALLAVWPYLDPRFFLPVVPLLAILLLVGLGRPREQIASQTPAAGQLRRVRGVAVATWLALFLLLGVAGFAYSTRISLAGRHIGEVYGDGTLTPTYRAALGQVGSPPADEVHPQALELLRRFEPRASQPGPEPSETPGSNPSSR